MSKMIIKDTKKEHKCVVIHILEKKASLDGQFTINEEIVESFIDKENK